VLAESHAELPLQVQRPRRGSQGEAILTLLTPGGALFSGDVIQLRVELRAGARVVLQQVSATQLHRCDSESIRLDADFHVAAGGWLRYQPMPLIPFAGSDYRQCIRVYLEQGAEARLMEVVTPGRLWEHFQYQRLVLRTEVFLDGRRIVLDAQRIEPAHTDCQLALGGRSHFATMLHLGDRVAGEEVERLHNRLADMGVRGSASLLPIYGVGARAIGSSAEELQRALE